MDGSITQFTNLYSIRRVILLEPDEENIFARATNSRISTNYYQRRDVKGRFMTGRVEIQRLVVGKLWLDEVVSEELMLEFTDELEEEIDGKMAKTQLIN